MKLRPGQRVQTQHGGGTVSEIEHYSRVEGGMDRIGVTLDRNPFRHPVAFYWPNEITIAKTK